MIITCVLKRSFYLKDYLRFNCYWIHLVMNVNLQNKNLEPDINLLYIFIIILSLYVM